MVKSNTDTHFIKVNLKSILKERNMTLSDLSKNTGISIKALSAFQNQKTEGVQYKTIERVTKVLGINVDQLLERIDSKFNYEIYIKNKNSNKIDIVFNNGVSEDNLILNYNMKHMQSVIVVEILELIGSIPSPILSYFESYYNADITQLYKIISYLIIQELQIKNVITLNIKDIVIVDWSAVLSYIENNNTLSKDEQRFTNKTQCIKYNDVRQLIKLSQLDPNVDINEITDFDNMKLNANVDLLEDYNFVKKVIIDENYKRKIYITTV